MIRHKRHPKTRERALALYAWIREYQHEHRYSPSFAEVALAFSMSTSHVKHVRDAMIDFKLMYPVDGRCIERAWPLRPIPKEMQVA